MPTRRPTEEALATTPLLRILTASGRAIFSVRLPLDWTGICGKSADALTAAGDGSPYHVLYGWGERPGLPPASRHLGRGTGRSRPSTHPVGSLPPRHRRIRSLTVIKQDARLWTIPVVVFTTSAQPHNIDVCYQLGVNSYMVKPMDFERLRYALELLMRYWFSVVTLPERRSP